MGDIVTLRFIYEDAQGTVSARSLSNWKESDTYIEGFCQTVRETRTFRKDRVVEYLDGCDTLLDDPYPKTAIPPLTINAPSVEILFTGFPKARRAELEGLAREYGLLVRKNVTDNLLLICAGPNAGPAKLARAKAQGVSVLNEQEFEGFLGTGEIPVGNL